MSTLDPGVSVVIPTRGGQVHLRRAIQSALAQVDVQVEVIVVNNGSGDLPAIHDPRVHFVRSEPEKRGNGARNRGIALAQYEWVALLDDDDSWEPTKLIKQLRTISTAGLNSVDDVIATCQLVECFPDGTRSSALPLKDPKEIHDAAQYLFVRDGVRSIRPQLQSSTLLASTVFARSLPFDETLALHQDWDWVVRSTDLRQATILHVHEPLVLRTMDVGQSVSSSIRWKASLAWAETRLATSSKRVRGDFALTVIPGFALAELDPAALRAAWRWAWSEGRPGLGAIVFFAKTAIRLQRRIAR